MDKINNSFQKFFKNIKLSYTKEQKNTFLITLITSMVVHLQLYVLMISGADTALNGMYHQADTWEPSLLRFGLEFVQAVKGGVVSPVLATLISSIFLAITVVLIIDILKIKNKCFKYITGIIFAVCPNISVTLTFFYCSDGYILGMLLAALAVYIMQKHEDKNLVILFSSILLACSMGMYQTNLSITAVLCLVTLAIDALDKKDIKKVFSKMLRYIIMGIIGIILYYVLSHVILLIKHLEVSNYRDANSIGLKTILEIPRLIPDAYRSFINYYFTDKMIPNKIWNTHLLYLIIFITAAISIIYTIVKNKVYQKIPNTSLIIISVIISPMFFSIIELIVPNSNINILMACSMILVFPIIFKILEFLPKNMCSNILKSLVVLPSIIIIWIYIWQDNASYIAINSMQNQTESLVIRLMTQIEQLDEYTPETPVLIIGGPQNNLYFDKNNTYMENKDLYNMTWGFISGDSTLWYESIDSWRKISYQYSGINVNFVKKSDNEEILKTEEYKTMKCYPEKESIKVINNIVVVKLSE